MGKSIPPRRRAHGGPVALRDGANKSLLIIAHVGWRPRQKQGVLATRDEVAPTGRRSDSV